MNLLHTLVYQVSMMLKTWLREDTDYRDANPQNPKEELLPWLTVISQEEFQTSNNK